MIVKPGLFKKMLIIRHTSAFTRSYDCFYLLFFFSQIGALSSHELHCPQSDGGSHHKYLYGADEPTLACTFMPHAQNQSTREYVK